MDQFLKRVDARGLLLYPAQEEAILAIFEGANVILNTPTGSGKSLVALAMHDKALSEGKRSFYTAPIKALVSEKFFDLCREFGADKVGMMTGDATVNREAPIICCTQEILAQITLAEGPRADVAYAIVDEFHYYSDKDRGAAWQIPLLDLPQATFLLMSATLGDTTFFEQALTDLNGRATVVVKSSERPVPLDFEYRETHLHETVSDCVRRGLTPVYMVNFTQRLAAEEAQNLMSTNFLSKEQKQAIAAAIGAFRFDTPFGKEVQRFLRHGIGIHHAGLLPKYRLLTEKLAQKGLLVVVSGTDTLGVGVNVPIRAVLFTKLCKFDGEKTAILTARDFHQIGGRAGRKGFDTRGAVLAQAPEHAIENKRIEAKMADTGKKIQKKKPPEKGYVHWDKQTFERLIQSPPEPLQSQFDVTHGMLLTILEHDRYERVLKLIARSHTRDYDKKRLKQKAANLFRSMRDAGVLTVKAPHVEVHDDLQGDFSLTHALSLWLVTALPSVAEPLDMLSFVEATVENPRAILERQLDVLKSEKMNEMKAEGIPFEERIQKLDELEYPKPCAEPIYEAFNAFRAKHPWLETGNIRPKSIARDMYERYMSFNEYVREYGLQRSEGVLLRYLGDVYRTLDRTVPVALKTEPLEEIRVFFHSMLTQVDTSLLEEWERLTTLAAPAAAAPAVEKKDYTAVRRAVRTQLHRLVKALAAKEWDDAVDLIATDEHWNAETLEKAMAPYFAEHGRIVTEPYTRTAEHTIFEDDWQVAQIIVDPEGHNEWRVVVKVDPDGNGPFRLLQISA